MLILLRLLLVVAAAGLAWHHLVAGGEGLVARLLTELPEPFATLARWLEWLLLAAFALVALNWAWRLSQWVIRELNDLRD
jgi:hypothetical protein